MGTDRLGRTRQSIARRRNRYLRLAGIVLTGVVLGHLCNLLPEKYAVPCHLASKVIALLVGSP